jgi:hypothetical protein
MADEGLGSLAGMEYTNRGASQTAERTIQTSQPEGASAAQTPPPPSEAPPAPEPKPAETPPSSDLISDLAKQFSQTIGEVPTPEAAAVPAIEQKPPSQAPEPPPSVEKTWRDEEAPKSFAKKAQEDWKTFKSRATADVEKGEVRIRELEKEVATLKEQVTKAQPELEQARRELAEVSNVVERVQIERSPLFKAKILDNESLLKARLAKMLEGTGVTAAQAASLLGGSMTQREQLLESSTLGTFRKQQLAEIMGKWDQVQEERERMNSARRACSACCCSWR